jgi:hypothetical protein
MTLGLTMALYHYPNTTLELGTQNAWAFVELLVAVLQPVLFAAGTAYWSVDAAWWGNTTLGCYLIHFYLRDRFTELIAWLGSALAWEPTGMLLPLMVISVCFGFTSTFGPLGHSVLIAPQLLSAWNQRQARQGASASQKKARASSPRVPQNSEQTWGAASCASPSVKRTSSSYSSSSLKRQNSDGGAKASSCSRVD